LFDFEALHIELYPQRACLEWLAISDTYFRRFGT
jgi:hypothetical protein